MKVETVRDKKKTNHTTKSRRVFDLCYYRVTNSCARQNRMSGEEGAVKNNPCLFWNNCVDRAWNLSEFNVPTHDHYDNYVQTKAAKNCPKIMIIELRYAGDRDPFFCRRFIFPKCDKKADVKNVIWKSSLESIRILNNKSVYYLFVFK